MICDIYKEYLHLSKKIKLFPPRNLNIDRLFFRLSIFIGPVHEVITNNFQFLNNV